VVTLTKILERKMITFVTILFTAVTVYICVSAKAAVVQKKEGKVTLEYTKEGLISNDYIFENAADEVCKDGFTILDKTPYPVTYPVAAEGKMYWIIECKEKGN
jgi:hypothetical protein